MTRQQTTPSREGAFSLSGKCLVWLAGGLQDLKPFVSRWRGGASVGYSILPRPFPLCKIYNPSRSLPSGNWAATCRLLPTSKGRRPFFFCNRSEKALQRLVQWFEFIRHCAFSDALRLPWSDTIQSDRGTKSCKRITKIWRGEK